MAGLLERLFKVIQATLHAVISKFEDPIKLAEQGIRDLKEDFDNSLKGLAEVKAIAISTKRELEEKKQIAQDYENKALAILKNAQAGTLDQAEADYESALAQVNAAKAKISQTKAQYNQSLVNLNYTKITAPVSGMIISREIDLGQPVAASFQTPTLFQVAQDLTNMQIEVNVSEADIGKIKKGQEVEYTLDGYADAVFHGKVTEVRIAPTTVSNVVTYTVIVDVDNKDQKMIPGMTANASIITNKSENVICVPTDALKFTPTEITGGKKYKDQGLWVIRDNKPQRITIKTGAKDSDKTEIISNQLKENDRVILRKKTDKDKTTTQARRPMRLF